LKAHGWSLLEHRATFFQPVRATHVRVRFFHEHARCAHTLTPNVHLSQCHADEQSESIMRAAAFLPSVGAMLRA
jgi:hypothetical protein